jgi:2,3-bisphosphoglycerate-dependent phosphoglycerate mutase
MELVIIRHALPVRRENVVDGPADPELSAAGHEQAKHLAAYLSTERFDVIYASPMRRAQQTAQPLAADQGKEIITEDGVAEYDRHSDTYIPVEEMKAAGDPRWKEVQGDDPAAFRAGVVTTLDAIAARHPGQKVAVVCHGGVIGAYLASVMRIPLTPDDAGFFYPNYTSIHRVMVSRDGVRSIATMNETSHLRNTGLPIGILDVKSGSK